MLSDEFKGHEKCYEHAVNLATAMSFLGGYWVVAAFDAGGFSLGADLIRKLKSKGVDLESNKDIVEFTHASPKFGILGIRVTLLSRDEVLEAFDRDRRFTESLDATLPEAHCGMLATASTPEGEELTRAFASTVAEEVDKLGTASGVEGQVSVIEKDLR